MPKTPLDEKNTSRRLPRWARVLLMVLLVGFVAVAFFLNFADVVEQLTK